VAIVIELIVANTLLACFFLYIAIAGTPPSWAIAAMIVVGCATALYSGYLGLVRTCWELRVDSSTISWRAVVGAGSRTTGQLAALNDMTLSFKRRAVDTASSSPRSAALVLKFTDGKKVWVPKARRPGAESVSFESIRGVLEQARTRSSGT
jgi:hypothetical protein